MISSLTPSTTPFPTLLQPHSTPCCCSNTGCETTSGPLHLWSPHPRRALLPPSSQASNFSSFLSARLIQRVLTYLLGYRRLQESLFMTPFSSRISTSKITLYMCFLDCRPHPHRHQKHKQQKQVFEAYGKYSKELLHNSSK